MKNVLNDKSSGSFVRSVVFGIIAGYVSLALLLVICAVLLLLADTGDVAIGVAATVILVIAGLVCGLVSAKKLGSKALIIGLLSGLCFYLTVSVVSLLVSGGGVSSLFLIRLLLTTSSAGIGGFLSATKKKTKSFI